MKSTRNSNDDDISSPTKELVSNVGWTDAMSECLVNSLLQQEAIGNRADTPDRRFSSTAYCNIIKEISQKFKLNIDKRHVKNRLKSIKENFFECYDLFEKQSGFRWDPESKTWDALPEVWEAYIEGKPDAKRWMKRPIYHYDKLLELFGKDRCRRLEKNKPIEKEKKRRLLPSHLSESEHDKVTDMGEQENEIPDVLVTKRLKTKEADFDRSNGETFLPQENGLVAVPVPAGAFGNGLPYAPLDWPCSGDTWGWKVGQRQRTSGHWGDRYLYPPARYCDSAGKRLCFKSKLQVEEFVRKEFPDTDVNTFFSSFIWKVPSRWDASIEGACENGDTSSIKKDQCVIDNSEYIDISGQCKARNKMCVLQKAKTEPLPTLGCHICCAEAGFCRDCCCILCSGNIEWSSGGYSFIRCVSVLYDNCVCGHAAHIECALRCYLSGTVAGSIGLDVEYYCRRCDNKTDLMPHVTQCVEICKSLEATEEIETILRMCICILRGSQQPRAKNLQNYVGLVLAKLKSGVDISKIWNTVGIVKPVMGGNPESLYEVTVLGAHDNLQSEVVPIDDGSLWPMSATSNQSNACKKLEDMVNNSLGALEKSQAREYRLAEEKLNSQKDTLLGLHQLLEFERSELDNPTLLLNAGNSDAVLSNITNLINQLMVEEDKLRKMMKVAAGFGQTSKDTLQRYFGVVADDDDDDDKQKVGSPAVR